LIGMAMTQRQVTFDNAPPAALQRMEIRLRDTLLRLQADADRSHEALIRSHRLLGRTNPEASDPDGEREARARARLLEWEAADLAQCVPGEMTLPRRRFAVHLYEAIRQAESLGMNLDRLLYHVQDARTRIRTVS
jgi:hypothetical protein